MLFPSILSELTSAPLALYHRKHKHNRLPNQVFQPLLQRKLRLPVLPQHLHDQSCPLCQTGNLDPHGDHLFQCKGISKTGFHNSVRDALYHVCKQLAPLAGFTPNKHAVTTETHVLGTTKRPADVGFHLIPPAMHTAHPAPVNTLALDVTITSSPSPGPDPPSPIKPLQVVHQDAQKKKLYCGQYQRAASGYTCQQWVHWYLQLRCQSQSRCTDSLPPRQSRSPWTLPQGRLSSRNSHNHHPQGSHQTFPMGT